MAFNFGRFNEFTDVLSIADPVMMAAAKAIQLGPWTGAFFQACGAPTTTIATKAFKVYNRTKTSRSGVIGASNWDDDDTTGLAMPATALAGLTIGHIIRVDDEYLRITAIDRDNNTISVQRGAMGTTAAAHTGGTAFKFVGSAYSDLDLKNVEAMSESTKTWTNGVQTIFEVVEWTKHGELVRKGLTPEQATALLIQEAEMRVAEMLALIAIHSRKNIPENYNAPFSTAGLLQQLTDTDGGNRAPLVRTSMGTLTERKFTAFVKSIFAAGGNPDTIWCSPANKEYFNAFNACNSALAIQTAKENHVAGGLYATAFDFEGAILKIRIDRDMPDDSISVVTQADCQKGWLANDGLRQVDEPQLSSREFRKSLQGSVGLLVRNVGTAHGIITGITGGPSERTVNVAGSITSVGSVTSPVETYHQITVNSDSDVPAAAAANIGLRVLIGTAWTGGTKIATAAKGEIWASSGAAWVKQS